MLVAVRAGSTEDAAEFMVDRAPLKARVLWRSAGNIHTVNPASLPQRGVYMINRGPGSSWYVGLSTRMPRRLAQHRRGTVAPPHTGTFHYGVPQIWNPNTNSWVQPSVTDLRTIEHVLIRQANQHLSTGHGSLAGNAAALNAAAVAGRPSPVTWNRSSIAPFRAQGTISIQNLPAIPGALPAPLAAQPTQNLNRGTHEFVP